MSAVFVLAVLWVFGVPIAAMIMASRAIGRSKEMSERLAALESQLSNGHGLGTDAWKPGTTAPGAGAVFAAPVAGDVSGPADSHVAEPEPVAELAVAPDPSPRPVQPWGPAPDSREAILPESIATETPRSAEAPGSKRPLDTLEGRIGGRWSVLVGGLAMALGAVFLVRYSIEQGLIGPRARIALGFLLAAALLAAGEILRRRDRAEAAPVFARADIPAILTGAGGIAAFATIYAAYALYGFLGDTAAFVLLTAAGLVILLLSVIHGPALAALGALGSYAAPLLISSAEPKPVPAVLHTLAVTAAVLAMARIRGWRWLAMAGIAASLAWGVLVGLIGNVNTVAAELLLLAGLLAIFIAALLSGSEPATLRDRPADPTTLGALAGITALSVLYALLSPVYPPLVSGIVLAGALGAVASRWTGAAPASLLAGALAVLTVMLLDAPGATAAGTMRIGPFAWTVLGADRLAEFAFRAAAIAFVVGLGSFFSAERAAATAPRTAGLFAAAGAGAPLLVMTVVYLRHVPFETRPAIGLAALAIAGIFAGMAERLIARRRGDLAAPAPALYAAGAVLALAFAMAVGLTPGFIPLALSLGAAGVAWVTIQRPVPALPWLAALLAALACAALIVNPPFSPAETGATPLLNGLVLRLGLPAAAVILAGEVLRRNRGGASAEILQAIGLALAALFVVAEIRHFAHDGVIHAGVPGLGEQSALTLAVLAFSLGLQWIAARTESRVYHVASMIGGIVGAAMIAAAHFITANPILTGEYLGERFFVNLLLPGYLLPALAAAWVASAARRVRPRWYVLVVAGLALALGFAYVTLTVRHAFHGGRLDLGSILDAENWTYSAVWLGFGIAFLGAGILSRSLALRAGSGIVIAAVVCKVFLFDMAALTGALRAASLLGLGATLIVIGRLYQQLLTSADADRPAPA